MLCNGVKGSQPRRLEKRVMIIKKKKWCLTLVCYKYDHVETVM